MKILVFETDGNALSERATLYPDSSVITTRKPLFLPEWSDSFATRVALAVRICRLGKHVALKFAHRYWDAATVCLVTSDAQASQPDALSQAFDGAIALGEWVEMDAEARNYMVVDTMTGDPTWNNASEQLARLADEAIVAASQRMTIKMGDVFCLAFGEQRNISIGDTLRVGLNGREILTIKIK